MASALEVVKNVYSRFAKGDINGFLSLCAGNIEWVVNGPANLEKCKAFKGTQRRATILARSWEFKSFTPRQFIVDGQTVVVLGEETGRDKVSGAAFENRWAHVFDIRDA